MNQDAIDAYYQKEQEAKERQQELDTTTEVGDKVKGAVEFQTAKLIANDRTSVRKVDIQNSLATPQDISRVVDVLEKLLVELKPEPNDDSGVIKSLDNLGSKLDALPKVFPDAPEAPESVKVNNLQEFENYLKPLLESVKSLQLSPVFDPKIEVKPADVNVTTEKVDLEPLSKGLKTLQESLKALTNKEQPTTDLGPVIKATNATTKAINNLSFPVPNYVLPFIKDGKSTQVTMNDDGTIPTASKSTDRYAYSAKSETATYKYFFFEDKDGNWYILRKELATEVVRYAKGTGGIDSVFDSSTTDPDGPPVFASYATTFN